MNNRSFPSNILPMAKQAIFAMFIEISFFYLFFFPVTREKETNVC